LRSKFVAAVLSAAFTSGLTVRDWEFVADMREGRMVVKRMILENMMLVVSMTARKMVR
jgi:hypothetical protein